MKYAVKDLEDALLDAAASRVDGCAPGVVLPYSTDWEWGGPIIEREAIGFRPISDATWEAENYITGTTAHGSTPLVAAMRCFVASATVGDEVELP